MKGWIAAGLVCVGVFAPAASAWDLAQEAANFLKIHERQALYQSVQGQLLLRQVSTENEAASVEIQLNDPERNFHADLCARGDDGCAGDARLYEWQEKGYGIVQPVLFTARNGATLSGRVWATKAGPAKRPGVVITNGSVQATEQMYWYAAQALAKAGYVVLTYDPQGQGQSDTPGESPDALEGVPAQSDGRPFYDGTVDALNFFLSSAAKPYVPVPSCETGTSHQPKQDRRTAAGLNAGFNPFWELLDPSRIGLAGHSYGASGVSYVAQSDPRVKAVVGWDNLGDGDPEGREEPCPSNPDARRVVPFSKPALGISADYGIVAQPKDSDPDPLSKSANSLAASKAGVDSGELVIRGGTHLDFSFISNPAFGATLRGADLIAWYTTAWFDKYVKGDPAADRRLLTLRWHHDGDEAAVDPGRDGDMWSFYYRSRLNILRADGSRFACEDLKARCAGMTEDDGYHGTYSYLSIATSPDGSPIGTVPAAAGISPGQATRCTKSRRLVIRVPQGRGTKVTRVVAYVGKKRVGRSRGRRVRVVLRGNGRLTVRLRVSYRRAGKLRRGTITRRYRVCA